MADLVEAFLARKPHFKAAQEGPGAVGETAPTGGGGGQETEDAIAKRMAEARKGSGEKKIFWDRGK
ncbi:MAG: hypothetical protein AB1576_01800 [Bacillota bacterium]